MDDVDFFTGTTLRELLELLKIVERSANKLYVIYSNEDKLAETLSTDFKMLEARLDAHDPVYIAETDAKTELGVGGVD